MQSQAQAQTQLQTNNDYVINALRKMDSTSRAELLSSIDKEEQTAKEELIKNPNLVVEKQLSKVLDELQEMRYEIQHNKLQQAQQSHQLQQLQQKCLSGNTLKSTSCDTINKNMCNNMSGSMSSNMSGSMSSNGQKKKCPFNVIDTLFNVNTDDTNDDDELTFSAMFSFDWIPILIFFIIVFLSLLPPCKMPPFLF